MIRNSTRGFVISLILIFLQISLIFLDFISISDGSLTEERYLDEIPCSSGYEIQLREDKTLIVKLSRSAEGFQRIYPNGFRCQFSVIRSEYGIRDVMMVIQRLNLRNYTSHPYCKDSITLEDTFGDGAGPICGKIGEGDWNEAPEGLKGPRSLNGYEGFAVTVNLSSFTTPMENRIPPLELELSFTGNRYCSNGEALKRPFQQCSKKKAIKRCIAPQFICDGRINCGFPGEFGADEIGCPDSRFKKTAPAQVSQLPFLWYTFDPIPSNPMASAVPLLKSPAYIKVLDKTVGLTPVRKESTTPSTLLSLHNFQLSTPTPSNVPPLTLHPPAISIISRATVRQNNPLKIKNDHETTGREGTNATPVMDHQKDQIVPTNLSIPLNRNGRLLQETVGDNLGIPYDNIHLYIPVHIFGLVSASAGALCILLLSVISCCLYCKFRQSKSKRRQRHLTSLVVGNTNRRNSNIPIGGMSAGIALSEYAENHFGTHPGNIKF